MEEEGQHKFGDTTFIHVRWFGTPWGREDKRASICEDDTYKIDTPVGTKCLACSKLIEEHQSGVVTACSPSIFGHWLLDIEGTPYSVCSYHAFCFIKATIGSDGLSEEIKARMNWRVGDEIPVEVVEEDVDVEPGRGWR